MMRAVQCSPGGPDNLTVGQTAIPELREREILIKVYATATNRPDTRQREGLCPPPAGESTILGLDAAGVVHSLGPKASRWAKGDRVMALLPSGGHAEYVAIFEEHVLPLSPSMTFIQAGGIPEAWLTAYQLLHYVDHLQPSDTVLIHAGGSGVGTAAIQLAALCNATVYVTAGSQAKVNTAIRLGAAAGWNYKEVNWAEKVLEKTRGQGVDMILDCVGASYWKQNTAAIALDGRWVLYGKMSGTQIEGNFLENIIKKRIKLLGSTLRPRSKQYKAQLVADFAKNALPHFANGTLKTVIDSIIPLDQISEAHRRIEANLNTGKIILEVANDSENYEL